MSMIHIKGFPISQNRAPNTFCFYRQLTYWTLKIFFLTFSDIYIFFVSLYHYNMIIQTIYKAISIFQMLKRNSNFPREETSKSEKRDNSENQRCMLVWRDDVHVDLQPFIYVMRFRPRRNGRDWICVIIHTK